MAHPGGGEVSGAAASDDAPRVAEDIEQHLFRKLASGGILLAGVIACEEDGGAGNAVRHVVAKRKSGTAGNHAARLKDGKVSIKANFAQSDHHFHVSEQVNFTLEKRPAISQFLRSRFVVRRRTA